MKKYSFLFLVLFKGFLVLGQGTADQIKTSLPTIIPPSPSVAALMKFEEVPVSNYTGIPDISIPLFNSPTLSKDINLDISLKYHPSGVAADERASDVGLGWSLFAGGTISRTVRGLPDEILKSSNDINKTKVGIFQTNSSLFNNKYYEFLQIKDNLNTISNYPLNNNESELIKEFLYESHEKGKYDTEHDLWQFNFMGKSGRFYIKKNMSTNLLEVCPLDNYTVKIVNLYGDGNNSFTPTSFIIYDEMGYKYVFDVFELTNIQDSVTKRFDSLPLSTSAPEPYSFRSSFHLTGVYDNNGQLLININYSDDVHNESVMDRVEIDNALINTSPSDLISSGSSNDCDAAISAKMEPTSMVKLTQRGVDVKKIKTVTIVNKSKIEFVYENGREDDDFYQGDLSPILKSLIIKDQHDLNVKKIELEQGYIKTIKKRMILESVSFKNFVDSKVEKYSLSYKNIVNLASSTSDIKKDMWGYFNIPNQAGLDDVQNDKQTNPTFCTQEILQKMEMPTGGSILFDFEPNTYSYIGSDQLPNFDDNPLNWDNQVLPITINTIGDSNQDNRTYYFTIYDKQNVFLKSHISTINAIVNSYFIYLFRINEDGTETMVPQGIICSSDCQSEDQNLVIKNLLPGQYKVSFYSLEHNFRSNFRSLTLTAYYKIRNSNNFEYLVGGGNRIKKIGYFASNVDQEYYYNSANSEIPDKEVNYKYNFFENSSQSSGSLVSIMPIYNYEITRRPCIECVGFLDSFQFSYNVTTSFNNVPSVKTGGSDIGYKNVTVSESNNGVKEYTYTSPIDFPFSANININYPFDIWGGESDNDCYRGNLICETIKDREFRLLKQTVNFYDYETYSIRIGLRTKYIHDDLGCPISYKYPTYSFYRDYVRHCAENMSSPFYSPAPGSSSYRYACPFEIVVPCVNMLCYCYSGEPDDFISYSYLYDTYGWAKLSNKRTINYFYDANNNQNGVETNETFTYNPLNKKLAEQTKTNSLGETLTTKYYYHTGNSTFSQNRISEIEKIETYRNGDLLSTSAIAYNNSWGVNQSYLPRSIATSKGNGPLEPRVHFNLYDAVGHPLEVQLENGTVVSYIWGYKSSQPVAKIENATYASIPSSLIQNIQTESDSSETGLEHNLTTYLKELRTAMPNAMVTTYTYIPLVGVATITDPRGNTNYYEYDSFGRLKDVRDDHKNILTENQYHYRTQN